MVKMNRPEFLLYSANTSLQWINANDGININNSFNINDNNISRMHAFRAVQCDRSVRYTRQQFFIMTQSENLLKLLLYCAGALLVES